MSPYEREHDRVSLVINRYGLEAARAFCEQGLDVYKKALNEPYGKVYRGELLPSIKYYENWLFNYEFEKACDL